VIAEFFLLRALWCAFLQWDRQNFLSERPRTGRPQWWHDRFIWFIGFDFGGA